MIIKEKKKKKVILWSTSWVPLVRKLNNNTTILGRSYPIPLHTCPPFTNPDIFTSNPPLNTLPPPSSLPHIAESHSLTHTEIILNDLSFFITLIEKWQPWPPPSSPSLKDLLSLTPPLPSMAPLLHHLLLSVSTSPSSLDMLSPCQPHHSTI